MKLDTTKTYIIVDEEMDKLLSRLAGRNGKMFRNFYSRPANYPLTIHYSQNFYWRITEFKNNVSYDILTGLKAKEVYPELFI